MEEAVNKKADESKKKKRTSLKSILGGDILATDFFRRQTKLLVLIMVFIIFYIHNRYASQQQQIEIDRLKKELTDIKYDALGIILAQEKPCGVLWGKKQAERAGKRERRTADCQTDG